MTASGEDHNCDLFLLSSHHPYAADRALAAFARRGRRNVDGWGIGSYRGGEARVLRSADPAYAAAPGSPGQLSREFTIASQAVASTLILGHLRLTSHGSQRVENNHPFKLPFLGYDWLLVHNGTAADHSRLVPHEQRLLVESDSDTPRVFEYLRREIIEYYVTSPRQSLLEACRTAYARLLDADPNGGFNLILSNGYLSFVFIHWRPFYLLHREKERGDVALITTIKDLSEEDWVRFEPGAGKQAKMLVFSGPTLVLNGDIPR